MPVAVPSVQCCRFQYLRLDSSIQCPVQLDSGALLQKKWVEKSDKLIDIICAAIIHDAFARWAACLLSIAMLPFKSARTHSL